MLIYSKGSFYDNFFSSKNRPDHPDFVSSSMETIMTIIIDESEEISFDLLSPLLDTMRKEDQVCLLIFSVLFCISYLMFYVVILYFLGPHVSIKEVGGESYDKLFC